MKTDHVSVSVDMPPALLSQVDELVRRHEYSSRAAAMEAALEQLLKRRMDRFIAGEAAKLDSREERLLAEDGMDDYEYLVGGEGDTPIQSDALRYLLKLPPGNRSVETIRADIERERAAWDEA